MDTKKRAKSRRTFSRTHTRSSFSLGAEAVRVLADVLGDVPTIKSWPDFIVGWTEAAQVLTTPALVAFDMSGDPLEEHDADSVGL